MITGIPPTGTQVANELLQNVPNTDAGIFANLTVNQLGPVQNNGNGIEIISYTGGPKITRMDNGNVNVRHVHHNGYNAIVQPNANPKRGTTPNKKTNDAIKNAAGNFAGNLAANLIL